jgi:uncharacterized protein (DUF3084 family)
MWEIAKFYISACSNSVQLVSPHPIVMSILFHHYRQLRECICEVEQIQADVSSKEKRRDLTIKEEENRELPTTLDSYFTKAK